MASAFNVVVGMLAALTFLHILERLGVSRAGAIAGTTAFAFGTPMLSYCGTFFSEPLVALCLLRAVLLLLASDPAFGGAGWMPRRLLAPGSWLGLAVTTHLSAVLWLPSFDLLYRDFDLSPFAPGFVLDGVSGPALARAFDIAPAWFAALTASLLCAASATAIVRARRGGTSGP